MINQLFYGTAFIPKYIEVFLLIIEGSTLTKIHSPYFFVLLPIFPKKSGYLPTLSVPRLAGLYTHYSKTRCEELQLICCCEIFIRSSFNTNFYFFPTL